MIDHMVQFRNRHGQHGRNRQRQKLPEPGIRQIDIRRIFEPAEEEGQLNQHLQNAGDEHAPGQGLNTVTAGKAHRRHDHRQAQGKARQLRRHEFLPGVEQGGHDDGGDVEHQRKHHDSGQLGRQLQLFRGKSAVYQAHQRPSEDVHNSRDHQRRQGEQIKGIAAEAIGRPGPAVLFRLHEKRHQRGGNAGIKQQYRQIEHAVRRGIGVAFDTGAEIIRGNHVPGKAAKFADDNDQRHRQRSSKQSFPARQVFHLPVSMICRGPIRERCVDPPFFRPR